MPRAAASGANNSTESLCLALLGGTVGLGVAAVGMRLIEALSPLRLPITQGVTLDFRVLGFAVGLSACSMLVVGFVPALFASGGGSGCIRARFPRTQKALTIAQVGISIGLLAAAGVLAHSLWRLNTVERGFKTESVLGFQVTVPGPQTEWKPFVDRALEAIAAIPGVEAWLYHLPAPETWSGNYRPFRLDGPPPEGANARSTSVNTIMTSADYFEPSACLRSSGVCSMRRMTPTARRSCSSTKLSRAVSAPARPVGQRVFSGFDTAMRGAEVAREIVGVVNDTRDRGMAYHRHPRSTSISARPAALRRDRVALADCPGSLIGEVRERLSAIRPDVPAVDFQTLDERVQVSLREPRFYVFLAAICAALAVLFAGVGLYGVVAYSVSARTTELGVRMALGSSRARILALVLWQGAVMAAIGAALGLVLAVASMRGLQSLLFEVSPLDPPTLAASVVFVIAVALIATFVPAWRACPLSPMTALRHE